MEGLENVVLFKSSVGAENNDGSGDSYIELLRRNGFDSIVIEPITFVFHVANVLEQVERFANYEGIVLTSTRAVRAFSRALDAASDAQVRKVWTKDRVVFVVGPRTAAAAKTFIDPSRVFGEQSGSVAALCPIIVQKTMERGDGRFRLLYPTSDLSPGTLHLALNRDAPNNVKLLTVMAYETVMNPQLGARLTDVCITNGRRILVFFSPSGVNNVLAAAASVGVDIIRNSKVIAVGPTTAAALETQGVIRDAVMEQPTPESLLQSIKSITENP